MTDRLLGASVWEDEVYQQLMDHIENEESLLGEYQSLADDTNAADVAYLVQFIVEDEMRHHRIIEQIAASVRAAADFGTGEDGVPRVPLKRADPGALVGTTDRLLAMEHEDRRALKELQRSLRPTEKTTLWSLLVKTMELDTRKHIAILRHIRMIAYGLAA